MSKSTRLFYLKESEVEQILFCDNSNNEDNLILDEEDIGFLEEDIQSVENTNHSGDYDAVVVIDPPTAGMPPDAVDSEPSTSQKELASSETEQVFEWKKYHPRILQVLP